MLIRSFIAWAVCATLVLTSTARAGAQTPGGGAGGGAMAVQSRVRAPEFDGARGWLNTDRPLSLAQLRGKIVLLDFWTYGCINCVHVIPDLKRLEEKYAKELVVIGVHSAKFENEKETDNIRRIILRYEIEHPVVNDADFKIWEAYAVRAWPTFVVIDPAGYVVPLGSDPPSPRNPNPPPRYSVAGEGQYEVLDEAVARTAAEFRKRGALNEQPLRLALERAKTAPLPLAFPGKVLADAKTDRLFVADSNHNRVVITKLDGTVVSVVGTGARGSRDGAFESATFYRPQGLALDNDSLYVADTANHLIRRVDLKTRQVSTVAGTGRQGSWLGDESAADARRTPLSSPWDLQLVGRTLYVAMAGPHQIWQLGLDSNRVSIFAGSGREARLDGPRLAAGFAQPSGLASDGSTLYVADSESNIIRAIDLIETAREAAPRDGEPAGSTGDEKERPATGQMPPDGEDETRPVVAAPTPTRPASSSSQVVTLAGGDLFEFGDADGTGDAVRLQHPLGVVIADGAVFIADTYNHKIKRLDPSRGAVKTFAGTGKPGQADGAKPTFYEPGGLSYAGGKLYVADTNNHAVRVVDVATGQTSTLRLAGLKPPAPAAESSAADAEALPAGGKETKLAPQRLALGASDALVVEVALPAGYHLNENAPHSVRASVERGGLALEGGKATLARSSKDLRLPLRLPLQARAAGPAELRVRLSVYYCREDNTGTCRIQTLAWRVPVEVSADAAAPREIRARGEVK
ncbi:MAG TPA: thioredoxin-like domain-containing protein [Pyrinomonadaceae bacterium]|nr:thioredoxin-like domain-containing protein [Pyrinomonadaceae bacterium]